MKALLFYPGIVYSGEQPTGFLYLSSQLKHLGVEVSLFDMTGIKKNKLGDSDAKGKILFCRHVKEYSPDVILFSVVSTGFKKSIQYARVAKQISKARTFFGGAHATIDPEGTIACPEVDYVCVGEGDVAVKKVFERFVSGRDVSGIDNIWFKNGGEIVKPSRVNLVRDIDSLPFPDRSILERHFRNGLDTVSFLTSRGCPLRCSYCHNPYLHDLYRGQGGYVRFHSVDRVLAEIDDVARKYAIRSITFSDDMFTANRGRVTELCRRLKEEIGLPFVCQTHVKFCDIELFRILKESGCELVSMGIESGNEEIRRSVLNRNVSNREIMRAFEEASRAGLKTGSFNLLGAPGETPATIRETIEINRQTRPDCLHYTIVMPFKGSPIRTIYEKNGWLKAEPEESYYFNSVIDLPALSSGELVSYLRTFNAYVRWPKVMYPLIHCMRYLWLRFPTLSFYALRFGQKFIMAPFHRLFALYSLQRS